MAIITPEEAVSLPGLFQQRVDSTPDVNAYRHFDYPSHQWVDITWRAMALRVAQCQAALEKESLVAGDRLAIMMQNGFSWVVFEQASLGLGLVVVPLYVNDRGDNVRYILEETNTKLLVIDGDEHWTLLGSAIADLKDLKCIVTHHELSIDAGDDRLRLLDRWLDEGGGHQLKTYAAAPDALATIVFTSGTTGRPKGVMLSHHNILWNAYRCHSMVHVGEDDLFLSFLPLSHMFERSVGYYLPMMAGAVVAYARSIPLLAEDLLVVKPTIIISVPRIFERMYSRISTAISQEPELAQKIFRLAVDVGWKRFLFQQRRGSFPLLIFLWPFLRKKVADKVMARLGGRIRLAVCGGAPLSSKIAEVFVGLGLPLLQGYGLTETSPVICANTLHRNIPDSVGTPLQDVEVKIGDNDELLVKSPGVMLGYWHNQVATDEMVDTSGWLRTGDKARIDNYGHIHITGRIKEIIVLSNGEKVPPADMEMAIMMDSLFEQVLIVGEGRPYLSALVVADEPQLTKLANQMGLHSHHLDKIKQHDELHTALLDRIAIMLQSFPGYAQVRRVVISSTPWTIENALLTPTLKLRRSKIIEHCSDEIKILYKGHK